MTMENDDLVERLRAGIGDDLDVFADDLDVIAAKVTMRQAAGEIARLTAERDAEREARKRLVEALSELLHAVCGPTGFAACVRDCTGLAYPWPALDIAEEHARAALGGSA
jgi:hypothetical protein